MLQIPLEKLQPSRPFSRVGPVSDMPCGCISLPITFGTAESFRTESVLFDITEVSLSFNTILGRLALYQFMTVAHYGYLVLKMPPPIGILRIQGDRDAGACTLEKLQALATTRELLQSLGARTLQHRARISVAQTQHPACSHLTRKMSP
jgi:hypothetical protein